MRITERLLSLVFPPVCASCKEPIAIGREDFLCEECRKRWNEEKNELCLKCGQPIYNCWCGVPGDKELNIDFEGHLTQYKPGEDTVTRNLLYFCKQYRNKDTFKYLSQEMANGLCHSTDENTVITAIPRAKSKKRKIGHDQSLEIAKGISDKLGIEYIDVLYHTGNKSQKTLTVMQREANAQKSYKIKSGCVPLIKGKNILLVDDVITTGATAIRCAKLLKSKGAKTVNMICISKTV